MKELHEGLPRYCYIPYTPSVEGLRLIHDTKLGLYWQVIEFADLQQQAEFAIKQTEEGGIVLHKKYPFILNQLNAPCDAEKALKSGLRASDWYAEIWLRANKKMQRGSTYEHFWMCDNLIAQDGKIAVIKMDDPQLFVKFNSDVLFKNYEEFLQIIEIHWISGFKPTAEEAEDALIDAYNFIVLQDEEEDRRFENNNGYAF